MGDMKIVVERSGSRRDKSAAQLSSEDKGTSLITVSSDVGLP